MNERNDWSCARSQHSGRPFAVVLICLVLLGQAVPTASKDDFQRSFENLVSDARRTQMKRLICCSSTSLWQTRRCLRTVQDNFALDRVFALIEGQPLSKSSEG